MDPMQALAVLAQLQEKLLGFPADQRMYTAALSTLREALIPDPVPNDIDPDGAGARPVVASGLDQNGVVHSTGSRQPQ